MPTDVVEGVQHVRGEDPALNYFKVDLNEGDVVYLHAVLEMTIDEQSLSRCAALNDYAIWIGEEGSCDEVMYDIKISENGEYLLKFNLVNNSGYFDISIIRENGETIKSSKGTVTNPVSIELGVQYPIHKNDFYNFFSADTPAIIYLYPSGSIAPSDTSRCIASAGQATTPDVFGVSIDGRAYTCSTNNRNRFSYPF